MQMLLQKAIAEGRTSMYEGRTSRLLQKAEHLCTKTMISLWWLYAYIKDGLIVLPKVHPLCVYVCWSQHISQVKRELD